jgi:pimeloyl-ACP methyl ester carboxylesterase
VQLPGTRRALTLADGRTLDYWEGGSPDGRPILLQPGTPSCRLQGVLGHRVALAAGVRLLSVSRPGYGSSTTTPPGLASVGADMVELADRLGVERFAVFGISGGGPFAVATALAASARVLALGVAAGVGYWPAVDPGSAPVEERRLLEAADAGDLASAQAGFHAVARRELDPLLALDDEQMVAAFFEGAPPEDIDLSDRFFRSVWAADMREALAGAGGYDGYVRDNLSWGMRWDVDPSAVSVPAYLWYGEADRMVPPVHGRWLADRLRWARLEVRVGEGHGRTCFGHWRQMFDRLVG